MVAYKTLSEITAGLSTALAILLLLLPGPFFLVFGIAGDEAAYFIGRRASMFFVGYAAIAFLSRREPPSTSRQSICVGIGTSMAGLAALGVFELLRGVAGPGILLAVVVELVLALSYFSIWSAERKRRVGTVTADQSRGG